MKSILQKTQILLLLFAFGFVFSQQKMKLPKDVLFYMEINGKQLNQKINWQKLNPFLLEVAKEDKEKQASWNDYSKTGIKYDATQYHYANFNDSVKTYTAHFLLDNKEKFQEFINSSKKKGLEISKRKNYSYVNLDDELFVAWNDKQAVLKLIGYDKPSAEWNDEMTADSAAVTIDSAAAVAVDSANVEKAFDYKEEIKYLKDDIQYLKEDIKEYKAEIAKKEKDIKYLEKHHKYPEEEKDSSDKNYSEKESEYTLPHMEEEMSEETEEDNTYQKKMDSLRSKSLKSPRNWRKRILMIISALRRSSMFPKKYCLSGIRILMFLCIRIMEES